MKNEILEISILKDNKEKKDAKRKYYSVEDANNLEFYNGRYEPMSLEIYFIRNDISFKYRRIFFQRAPLTSKITEYITGVPFDSICLTNKNKFDAYSIYGDSNSMGLDEYGCSVCDEAAIYAKATSGISLHSDWCYKVDYKDVLNFLRDLKNDGELKPYIRAVTSFMSNGLRCTRARKIDSQINGNNEYNIIETDLNTYNKVLKNQ